MNKNIKKCTIDCYECKWTGANKKEIEKFFKLCEYKKFSFIEDYCFVLEKESTLLYDESGLIEPNTIIIANTNFGIIAKFKEDSK